MAANTPDLPLRAASRLPTPLVLVAVVWGAVTLGITATKGLQDADYFWHVTAGRLIATTGRVPSTDPFSFTWGGQPWTPHEWLAELIMFWVGHVAGDAGLLLFFGLVVGGIGALFALMLGRSGVRPVAFALAAVVSGLALAPYLTVRPQAFSWLLLTGLIAILTTLRADRPRRVLWLVPYFVLWANLHGLYVIGLGVVALYAAFTLAGRTPMASARGWVVAGAIGCLLASMLTPAGPVGIFYPLRYMDAGDWGLAHIQEWQSPNFHDPVNWPFLLLVVAVLVNRFRATPWWLAAISIAGLAGGLVALRNVPLAAILSLPTLALGIEARMGGSWRRRTTTSSLTARRRRGMETITAAIVVVAVLVLLVPHGLGASGQAMVEQHFPVRAVDTLAARDPQARTFAEYGWGGYVIYRLYDSGGRVFVDGRNDMYADQILDEYVRIRNANDGWQALMLRYGVQAIVLPPDAPLVRGAATAAGWCEAYRDGVAVLLLPSCG